MHHGHVLGPQHLVYGFFLRGVEPGKRHGGKGELAGLAGVVKHVAQLGQAAVAGTCQAVEGGSHEAIGGFVKGELHAQQLAGLELGHAAGVGHGHHHALGLGIAHSAGALEVAGRAQGVDGEKHDLAPVFKVVLDVGVVGSASELHHQLVERVVVAAARLHGIPAIAAFHLALDAQGLGLPLEFLFLGLVLELEQLALLVQLQYGVDCVHRVWIVLCGGGLHSTARPPSLVSL